MKVAMQSVDDVIRGIEIHAREVNTEDIVMVERFIEHTDEALVILCELVGMRNVKPQLKGR